MIDPKVKAFCENADYEAMLRKQRHGPAGDPFFQMNEETWAHWTQQFNAKRAATGDNGVGASKRIGW